MKESVIKWQTGEPKSKGYYLISMGVCVDFDVWMGEDYGWLNTSTGIVDAWYPLFDIEPYKEE